MYKYTRKLEVTYFQGRAFGWNNVGQRKKRGFPSILIGGCSSRQANQQTYMGISIPLCNRILSSKGTTKDLYSKKTARRITILDAVVVTCVTLI